MAAKPSLGRGRQGRLRTRITGGKGGLGAKPYKPRNQRPPKPPVTNKPGLGQPPAAPPAMAAAAPAAPVGQHAEPDAAFNKRVDIAEREGSTRLNELDSAEQKLKFDTGIDDPTNPFSRAEGLKRSFLARQKAASAGLASQGQLYSGAHERALSRTRRDEEEARAALRASYDEAINRIGAAKAGVKFDTEEQRAQAFEDWLARADDADVDLASVAQADAENVPAPPAAVTPPDPGAGFKAGSESQVFDPFAPEGLPQAKFLQAQKQAKAKQNKALKKAKAKAKPKVKRRGR